MSLEQHGQQPRARQNALRGSAVPIEMNCSVELDQTPKPANEVGFHDDIIRDIIDLSAETEGLQTAMATNATPDRTPSEQKV